MMSKWPDETAEFEDYPEEFVDGIDENISKADIEIPDVWWAEYIEKIEDPEIREKEIEAAERLIEKKKALNDRLEAGKITQDRYDDDYLLRLRSQERKAATRCSLESVGITYDHLGDLSEDHGLLSKGDVELIEAKEELKQKIRELGPDQAQQLADRMFEEGELSEDAHESISRQARLQRLSEK